MINEYIQLCYIHSFDNIQKYSYINSCYINIVQHQSIFKRIQLRNYIFLYFFSVHILITYYQLYENIKHLINNKYILLIL